MPVERPPEQLYIGHQAKSIKEDRLDSSTLGLILSTANQRQVDFIVLPIDPVDLEYERSVLQQELELLSPYTTRPSSATRTANKPIVPESDRSSSDNSTRQWIHHQAEKGPYNFTPFLGNGTSIVPSASCRTSVVLSMSSWIQIDDDVPESATSRTAQSYCRAAFLQQFVCASHCGADAVILPTPTVNSETMNIQCARYASLVINGIGDYVGTDVWVRIPVSMSSCDGTSIDGWRVWTSLRASVGEVDLGVALVIGDTVPDNVDLLERWIAEPVRAVIIPGHLFVMAPDKTVTLPQTVEQFVTKLMRRKRSQIIIQHGELSGKPSIEESIQEPSSSPLLSPLLSPPPSSPSPSPPLSSLVDCIKQMFLNLPPLTDAELVGYPFLDVPQFPLQPWSENHVAETFAKDSVKYAQYEEAIYICLLDRIAAGKVRHVLMIVGGGRGPPLVQAAWNALHRARVDHAFYRIIAIERNIKEVTKLRPPAYFNAEVVWSDLKSYKPSEKVDIMITELLGSFVDNELSPECLDGAQTFLAEDGVMIPTRYWSSIEPVSTPKLWFGCKHNVRDRGNELEKPYVARFHSVYRLSTEGPLKCFEFDQPLPRKVLPESKVDDKYQQLSFTAKADSICHGFAGYFHCDLYKDIHISTHPPTKTEGMLSWLPIYFPLQRPMHVRKDQALRCHFWRHSNCKRMWYEWSTSEPTPCPKHNILGRSHFTVQLPPKSLSCPRFVKSLYLRILTTQDST